MHRPAVDSLRQYITRWNHPDSWPVRVPAEELDRVEARFETYLPMKYRECMESIGPPGPSALLTHEIVERRLDLPTIGEFYGSREVIQQTEGWRGAGLPENMVAFAGTESGDLYCFEVVPEGNPIPEDATVWYFDHEEREVESLDVMFSRWLQLYAELPQLRADA